MEIFWPVDLPQCPALANNTYASANNTVIFKTEYGPAKVRRRTSANMGRRTWQFTLSREFKNAAGETVDQFRLFLDFMEITEGFSFWFPDPMNQAQYIKVRFVSASEDTGQELTPYYGDLWAVTTQVEVWPHAYRKRA
ncbi:MAG: hypothetical protein FWG04_05175 [Desulfovibrionaceae bacterium]|nr:hypothetical protein [Desulfovibrionaceae bacterium]